MKDGHIFFRMHPNVRGAYSREIPAGSQRAADGYMLSLKLEEGESLDVGGFLIRRDGNRICTDRSAVYPSLCRRPPSLGDAGGAGGLLPGRRGGQESGGGLVNDGEYVISNAVYGLTDEIRCGGAGADGDCRMRIRACGE